MTIIAIRPYGRFAERWATALRDRGVETVWVNPFEGDAVGQFEVCRGFFCAISHDRPLDLAYLPGMLDALEVSGLKVFPDRNTRRGFDNKIQQYWLLRRLGLQVPCSWIFFDEGDAVEFAREASYPLVFKLARGAGSQNVQLVSSVSEGLRLVRQMFGMGRTAFPAAARLSRAVKMKREEGIRLRDAWNLTRSTLRLLRNSFSKNNREFGYILFQKLIDGNDKDYRVTVIGERAFVFFRGVPDNDFRASGSGRLLYPDPEEVDHQLIETAFAARDKLGSSTVAMDFVKDHEGGGYLLLEFCFSFIPDAVEGCAGYFNRQLDWIPEQKPPEFWIVEDFLKSIENQ